MSAINSNNSAVKYEHIDIKLDADQFTEMCPMSKELDIKQEDAISIKSENESEVPNIKQVDTLSITIKTEDEIEQVLNISDDNANDIKTENDDVSTRKIFKCHLCDYTSINKKVSLEHRRRHSKIKPLICTECSYKSSVKSDFRKHVLTRHSKEKKFKCNQCVFSTNLSNKLKIHVEMKHEKAVLYQCDECSYATAWKYHFNIHKKNHMRQLKCNKCAYATTSEKRMLKHKQKHVNFDKNNEYVRNIMIGNNTDDKRYKCTQCDYSCKFIAGLVTHMKTHQVT